jgi:hypothetical protein
MLGVWLLLGVPMLGNVCYTHPSKRIPLVVGDGVLVVVVTRGQVQVQGKDGFNLDLEI